MREFVISSSWDLAPLVIVEKDVFGVVGQIFSLISELDPGDSVVISCNRDVEE